MHSQAPICCVTCCCAPHLNPGMDLVPRQWLRYEFATEVGMTTVWVSIQEGRG